MSQQKTSPLQKAGIVLGLATFLVTNAQANPFQAEVLKTGYGNQNPNKPYDPNADHDPNAVANPNDNTDYPNSNGKIEKLNSDALPNPNDNRGNVVDMNNTKATDGKCGMSGTGE